ncbi:hypothetical protein NEF87_004891 [Candidatus Lokiarchaeum ossiferum]|uniref:Cullin family profile domain-containing protein n=1 Tax=Candidatus Lokiarchaeum ossiferum TaxID=2951803 RepID=A0ABY6HZ31_9ARCH|nr:hypothetical protein NEF87_004891 [Candidatus Lokiarchaeum sp. B-35]
MVNINQLINEYMRISQNKITIEYQEKLSEIQKKLSRDPEYLDEFLEGIESVYNQEEFPSYSASIFARYIFVDFHGQNNSILKSAIKKFIWENIQGDSLKNQLMGLHILAQCTRLFFSQMNELLSLLFNNIYSDNLDIITFSLIVLDRFASTLFQKFEGHFNRLQELCLTNENEYIIAYSMKILGECFLRFARNIRYLDWSEEIIDKYLENYNRLNDEFAKQTFIDGLHYVLFESRKYKNEWILIIIDHYNSSEDLRTQSQLLRILNSIPSYVDFQENSIQIYVDFFTPLLNNILEVPELDLPPESIQWNPNFVQDILSCVEQTSFYCPLIAERLLPLYEKIHFEKVVPNIESSFFSKIHQQDIHSIYINLIKHYKKSLNSKKVIMYNQKAISVSISEKEKAELEINIIQHEIPLAIGNRDIKKAKSKFETLHKLFDLYNENFDEVHKCLPTWTIIEDLLYLTHGEVVDTTRNIRKLKADIEKFGELFPSGILKILNKWQEIPVSQQMIPNTEKLVECQLICKSALDAMKEILLESEELESPVLKKILQEFSVSNQLTIRDIATERGLVLIESSRRKLGLQPIFTKTPQFNKLSKFLSNLKLEEMFSDPLPHEDRGINPRICEELRNHFPSVVLNDKLVRTTHIDISVDNNILIEVKKIESNTAKDEVLGQLIEDMRITNKNLGIALGIDQTVSKMFSILHQQETPTDYGIVKWIILQDPFK